MNRPCTNCRSQRAHFILLSAFVYTAACLAQAPDTMWTGAYGTWSREKGFSVCQTSDGGYIAVGEREYGFYDLYVVKVDSVGNLLWTKEYGGDRDELGRSVIESSDGCYVAAGIAKSFGGTHVYLLKLDTNGDTLWAQTLGLSGTNNNGFSVQQTTDGGYAIGGYTRDNALLVKTDEDGNALWMREYGTQRRSKAYCVDQTSDGGYILGGCYSGDMRDWYFVKTDSLGDTLWTRRYGGANDDRCFSVQQTADGGYIAVGGFDMLERWGADVCLMKLNQNGDIDWQRMIGGESDDVGYSVQQLTDGGYIIAGRTLSFGAGFWDAYVVRTDSMGDTLWTEAYGGSNEEQARSIQVTSDGGYVVAGHTSSFGAGSCDIYLIKIAEDTIGVAEHSGVYVSKLLLDGYPNPFCKMVTFTYMSDGNGSAGISIYDISGCLVQQFDRLSGVTRSSVVWNGLDSHGKPVPAGVYFVVLHASDQAVAKKILLVR